MSMLPPLMEQEQPSRTEIEEFMNAVNSIRSHCFSVISLAQQWRTLQSSFNSAQASFQKHVEEVERKEMELRKEKLEMEEKEKELSKRIEAVETKGKLVREWHDQVELVDKLLMERGFELELKKVDLCRRLEALELREKEFEEKSMAFEARRKEFEEKSMGFEAKEKEFEEKSMAFEAREKEIEEKSMAFQVRRKEIEEKSMAFEAREKEIEEKSMAVEAKEKEVEEKSVAVEAREKEIEEKSVDFEVRRKEFEKRWQECESSEKVTISTSVFGNGTNVCSEIESACTNMDANGVRSYLYQHVMDHKLFPQKVMDALKSAPDPATLVFEVLQSFNLPQSSTIDKTGCIFLLQQLMKLQKPQSVRNPFGEVYQVSSPPLQITQDMRINALEFASIWKRRFTEQGLRPLDVYGFLQFVACYELASLYDGDELMQLFAVLYDAQPVYWPEENPQLCRALGLTNKIPDLITSLIEEDRRLQAAKYICTFMEESHFPLALLLKDHLNFVQQRVEEIREMSKDKSTGKIEVMFELSHLREVVQYIKDYKLEQEFSPTALESCIIQLEATMANLKTFAPES